MRHKTLTRLEDLANLTLRIKELTRAKEALQDSILLDHPDGLEEVTPTGTITLSVSTVVGRVSYAQVVKDYQKLLDAAGYSEGKYRGQPSQRVTLKDGRGPVGG